MDKEKENNEHQENNKPSKIPKNPINKIYKKLSPKLMNSKIFEESKLCKESNIEQISKSNYLSLK